MEKQFLFVDAANPTWLVYVSVLVLAVFFRFSRLFTVRNLDVLLILVLSTSLVLASASKNAAPPADESVAGAASLLSASTALPGADGELQSDGPAAVPMRPRFTTMYQWSSGILLILSVLLILRLMFDEALTRRPRLEQNLNQAGLTFLCIPAFILLTISVFVVDPPESAVAAVEQGRALLQRRDVKPIVDPQGEQPPAPTETLIAAGAAGVAQLSGHLPKLEPVQPEHGRGSEAWVAQILVVMSHTIVVLGLLYIGKHHFSSLQLGLSMSCLYLLLPCTGYHVHQLSHVLPGACLTWAIASYRKPVVAGVLLGLACGTLFFAVFLLPVWAAFYGRRGSIRFGIALVGVAAILVGCLLLTSSDADSFMNKLVTTMNWTVYRLLDETGSAPEMPFGHLFVRIPLAAVFFVMLTAMTVLPRPRNLENLLANSTALVVTAQLWYPDDIGSYVLWYLPLLLLVAFRPRLDRFMPPDLSERQSAPMTQPTTAGAPAAVAMSRLTLYQ